MDEYSFHEGWRSAYRDLLRVATTALGYDYPQATTSSSLLNEREGALVVLRRLCERYGDTEWTNYVTLADILENHLERHLNAHPLLQKEEE